MMKRNVIDDIKVDCNFKVVSVLECRFKFRIGEHAQAKVTVIADRSDIAAVTERMAEEVIIISGKMHGEGRKQLFSGIISTLEMGSEGQLITVVIHAHSLSKRMDYKKKSRSFQDISLTYKDVVERVCMENGIEVLWNTSNRRLSYPLIQYRETDYAFIRRVLSHLGEQIIAQPFIYGDQKKGCVQIGIGREHKVKDINQYLYAVTADSNHAGLCKGYELLETDIYQIGDRIVVLGDSYLVAESEGALEQGIMKYRCKIYRQACLHVEKILSKSLKGTVINASVLDRQQEKVRLHLWIDKVQEPRTAYDYPWHPITGSLLYCMPDKGTTVALYLRDGDEAHAEVIYSVRENGHRVPELGNPSCKYFTTEVHNRLYMEPQEMGMIHKNMENAQMRIADRSQIGFNTRKKLKIVSDQDIVIKGKTVNVSSRTETTLIRKDALEPAVINLSDGFDSVGAMSGFMHVKAERNKEDKENAGLPD